MDINGNQVIAVDFDGTLCKQAWPEIGEENEILIEHLKEQQAAGARLIKRTSEILLAIFTLTNCGTLQELEYHTGYYAGTADQAAAVGEITREQRGQILRVLHYISAGERERLENE